jgi:hypothetical protein
MKKVQIQIALLVLSILISGCMQSAKAGKLILNQDQIKTIEIREGPTDKLILTLSDSMDISSLIDMIKEIPVKRLTKQEDIDFMPTRILEDHLTVDFDDYNNPVTSLQGEFLIWPDGYIYSVAVDSMKSNQRTISYLSQSKYPELYQWLIHKAKQP